MSSLLLTGGRIIDPSQDLDAPGDLLLRDGKVAAIGKDAGSKAPADAKRVDVKGLIVCPGLIDLHVHLREPGQEYKETVATGAAAAVAELLQLNQNQFSHALATVATFAAALQQAFRMDSMSKPLHAGRAAEAGVTANMPPRERTTTLSARRTLRNLISQEQMICGKP